ncbi:unnamed protein product, partial [Calicophoron daubneyi]
FQRPDSLCPKDEQLFLAGMYPREICGSSTLSYAYYPQDSSLGLIQRHAFEAPNASSANS